MTHAVWTWLFLGKVKNIKVAREGGEVLVSKSNFLTTLAPYFFPFYTALIMVVWFLMKLFWYQAGEYYPIFLFLVGFTWSFHLLLTLHILRTEQSDIRTSGVIFSALLIILLNLQVIVALLNMVFAGKVSWVNYNMAIGHNSVYLCRQAWQWLVSVI